ncbi:energy transducer TonB [Confluentibacter lentus]|uniref:energy transducer TonB n=1 Tax=Confluentibacter lentus TaxID=1699412 RepID=UPI000C28744F|nr:energy transducer TonB [Confluentibacter lentus]
MKFLETKHERDSAKLTTLITVILILLLFVVGAPYMDPPIEYGVAVNFGTTDFGKGDVQPLEPIKSEPKDINELYQPDVSKTEPTKASESKEEVLTQDNQEAIAIKKQKQAEANAKAIADAKAKAEADRIAKEKQEQDDKKRKLDALIGGVSKSEGTATGGEGNDNKAGDKGQLDGDPYAPSYFGSGGSGSGGVGYGLNGRGRATYNTLKQNCNESGMVIVRITVNRNGNVIEAEPGVKGTTNTAPCLLEPAKKIALSHKWQPDPNAPTKQIGFVKVNFQLGQ